MTEGEWMGDRWSMMLSLKKKESLRRKEEENVSLCSPSSLFFSLSLSLSFLQCQKKKREREKQKLSSPLETNQLDFFSHFFLCLYYKYA